MNCLCCLYYIVARFAATGCWQTVTYRQRENQAVLTAVLFVFLFTLLSIWQYQVHVREVCEWNLLYWCWMLQRMQRLAWGVCGLLMAYFWHVSHPFPQNTIRAWCTQGGYTQSNPYTSPFAVLDWSPSSVDVGASTEIHAAPQRAATMKRKVLPQQPLIFVDELN